MKTLFVIDTSSSTSTKSYNEYSNEIKEYIKYSNQPISDFKIASLRNFSAKKINDIDLNSIDRVLKSLINQDKNLGTDLVGDLNNVFTISKDEEFKKIQVFTDLLDNTEKLDVPTKIKVDFFIPSNSTDKTIQQFKSNVGKGVSVITLKNEYDEEEHNPSKKLKI